MNELIDQDYYLEAKKNALKEYNKLVSSGELGYVPSLEGLVNNADIVTEINLGLVEVPLKKIIGTYTHLRSLCFSKNFMPLLNANTEFERKWSSLCQSHLTEGIRDPIKVYEYLNWFYVIEGNKRVSVLKYFNAYAITANVIRLIPKKDENNENIKLYYEFLKFNKETGIYSIWLTKEKSYELLLDMLMKYNPKKSNLDSLYRYFEVYIYNPFRALYHSLGGDKLNMTTGDAFMEFAKIYGIPESFDEKEITTTLKELIKELELMSSDSSLSIQTSPEAITQKKVITAITNFVAPRKKLKLAFVYSRSIETSGWTYAHELGRLYLNKVLGDQLTTSYVENIPENDSAYYYIKHLAEEGNDIIFTTSPIYMNATLKCALEFPQIKFFNCSESHPFTHVANYYGRTYEPRFLTGVIAGAMTKTNIIGYAATKPTPEVISSINAFALGAKMVNPYSEIKVAWTEEWNSRVKFKDAGNLLISYGCDMICNRTLSIPHPVSTEYGVYSMLCSVDMSKKQPDRYLATPIWQWGIFYEKILKNILSGTFKTVMDLFSSNQKLINFWWGIDSGVVDIFYSEEHVPEETQKLVKLMKRMIVNNLFNPFTGPIYDDSGNLRIESEEVASHEQILSMDWFIDSVDSNLVQFKSIK
ncbi:MAG TPA: BMP family ABC transporter substrate-binding protein [Clostridiaceae bacterium]